MKLIIPEIDNPVIKEALTFFPDLEILTADSLDEAAAKVADQTANTMLSGLDYSSRDVLLAYKNHISLKSQFFSSCFICKRENSAESSANSPVSPSAPASLTLADGGVNKLPTSDQLYTIVEDTAKTHETYFGTTPKIAMLSYSTYGSGGKNPDLKKIYAVIEKIRKNHPNWLIDGEMQLDAAVSPEVAAKKTPNSPLQGSANILITPDLNSGNILYKSLERFGGFTCAGPIIQGFVVPLADLSRGSTVKDVVLTIDVIKTLYERKSL